MNPFSPGLRWLPLLAALGLGACATVPGPEAGGGADPATVVQAPVLITEPPPPALPARHAAPPEPEMAPPAPPLERFRLDPDEDAARASLWERVRSGMAIADLDDEWVRKWEQYYASRPEYVQRIVERSARYLFHIVEEIERRGLPMDLALLPFIESAFNPEAMSRARASGMWQFMPATGKDFELRQNLFRDDRRDVLASTRAALDYLQRLHKRFGDWHLALAAYNWGQGNVQRTLDRQRQPGRELGYSDLRGLPVETRDYVRKLQAVKNIVRRPEAFGLVLPPLENHPFFLTVAIDHDIDVALAAGLAGLTVEQFQQLNPQLNKPVILAAGTPQVLLPYDNANRFVRALHDHRGAKASWTAWIAPRTLKASEAARLVGMPEAQLREVNRIPERMLVRVGSTLLVPRSHKATANVSEHIAENATLSLAPEARKRPAAAQKKSVSPAAKKASPKVAVRKPAPAPSASSRARARAPSRK